MPETTTHKKQKTENPWHRRQCLRSARGPPAEEVEVPRSGGVTDESKCPRRSARCRRRRQGDAAREHARVPARCWGRAAAPARPVRILDGAPRVQLRDTHCLLLLSAMIGRRRRPRRAAERHAVDDESIQNCHVVDTSPGWLRKTPWPSQDEAGNPGASPPTRRELRSGVEACGRGGNHSIGGRAPGLLILCSATTSGLVTTSVADLI